MLSKASSPGFVRFIPNGLTVLRLVLAAGFGFAPEAWRVWMIVVAGGSDAIDGWIARRFGVTSWVGAMMDGVADKAFTLAVLVTFTLEGRLGWPAFGLLLVRDVVVLLIALLGVALRAWEEFRQVSAKPLGKLATVVFFGMMIAVALESELTPILVVAGIGASIAAGIEYAVAMIIGLRRLRAERRDGTRREIET